MKTKQIQFGVFLTPEQKALWTGLKDCRLAGRKFSIRKRGKQAEVEFYCASENLSIDISDHSHFQGNQLTPNKKETSRGYVLHFPMSRVRVDLGRVLAQIRGHFNTGAVMC